MGDTTTDNPTTTQPMRELQPLLLTAAQVGELLGLSGDGVRYLHRVRKLPGVIVNRKLRFSRKAVEGFVRRLEEAQN